MKKYIYYLLFYSSVPIGTAIYGTFIWFWWLNAFFIVGFIFAIIVCVEEHKNKCRDYENSY